MKIKRRKRPSLRQIQLKQKSNVRKIKRRKIVALKKRIYKKSIIRDKRVTTVDVDTGTRHFFATPPSVFSLDNLEESLLFINTVSKGVTKDKTIKKIFFDLSHISDIDYVGICLMLSLSNKLVGSGLSTHGNYPIYSKPRDFILESGFCELVKTNVRRLHRNVSKNMLYMLGGKSVDNRRIGESIKEAVFRLTGHREHYAPVYENMLEICANSVEHGNELIKDKNWLVSVSFKDDVALFVLMDTGDGILRTLKKKAKELFIDMITFKSDGAVLNDVFNKKYQSATGEINRHKGLPNILASQIDGYIDDLVVLTNNVRYDFKMNQYIKLKHEYKGTAIIWKLTKNNIEKYNHEN